MIPATDRFAAAIGSGWEPVVDAVVVDGNGDPMGSAPITGGTFTADASTFDRYRVDLEVAPDREWLPSTWSDPLVPTDRTVRLYAGARWPDGTSERFRVSTTYVDAVDVSRPSGAVKVETFGRVRRVSQAGLPARGVQVADRMPGVDFVGWIVAQALGHPVPTTVEPGVDVRSVGPRETWQGDPWAAVEDVADSGGAEAYFDRMDRLTIRPAPTPRTGDDVVTLRTGESGTLVDYRSRVDRSGVNRARVAFTSAGGERDVVSTATLTSGPARWEGPYGRVRGDFTRYGNPSQAQADRASSAFLSRMGGILRACELTAAPDPRVECGDTVRIVWANGAVERHVVTFVSWPLLLDGPMTIRTRTTVEG
jgi:hypothetical protein